MTLRLISPNNNGLLQTKIVKGKQKDSVRWDGVQIENAETGEIICQDVLPKFEGWAYEDFVEQYRIDKSVRYLEPMGAHEPEEIDETEHDLAELKRDGHRALCHIRDTNRMFSRYVSKKSNWYTENTDQVPHIRDLDLSLFEGTVLDGELDYDQTSNQVSSVTLSLPENAIQHQFENGFITYYLFDILYYRKTNIQQMPIWKRKVYLALVSYYIQSSIEDGGKQFPNIKMMRMFVRKDVWGEICSLWANYFAEHDYPTEVLSFLYDHVDVVDSYADQYDELIRIEKEGLIVKPIWGVYEQKKSNNQLKMKVVSTWDVIFLGVTEPTKEYTGKLLKEDRMHEWKYWLDTITNKIVDFDLLDDYDMHEGMIPVTKPYAKGWCGGIRCGVYKQITFEQLHENTENGMWIDQALCDGTVIFHKEKKEYYWMEEVAVVKGLSEEYLEDIKKNAEKYRVTRVLEVEANGLIDKKKGTLRHPRFSRWRDDKTLDMCLFEYHIREEIK